MPLGPNQVLVIGTGGCPTVLTLMLMLMKARQHRRLHHLHFS
jgi:hypothetical protein